MYGIDEKEYMMSLGPEQILGNLLLGTLSSLSTTSGDGGRSGSFFFFRYQIKPFIKILNVPTYHLNSHDGRFLVKTIAADESFTFLKMMEPYYKVLILTVT